MCVRAGIITGPDEDCSEEQTHSEGSTASARHSVVEGKDRIESMSMATPV